MNPFDLVGVEFLVFYGILAGATLILGLVIRFACRGPGGEPGREADDLTPCELAYLADGEERATQAAIANLARRKLLDIDGDARTLRRAELSREAPSDATDVELAVFDSTSAASGKNFDTLRKAARVALKPLRNRLIDYGLIVPPFQALIGQWLPVLLMFVVVGFGVARLAMGLSNGRPVGYLVGSILATLLVMYAVLTWPLHRSRRGDRALKQAIAANAALKTQAATRFEQLSAADALLAVGLFGPTILGASSPDGYQAYLLPPPTSGSSGCGSGSSCGGGCGGGGCGGCGG